MTVVVKRLKAGAGSVPETTEVIAGNLLDGGGPLTGDVTIDVNITDLIATVAAALVEGTNLTITYDAGTDTIELEAASGGGPAAFSGARVRRTTNTTLSSGSWQFFAGWDAELFDPASYHDNSTNNTRLTAPVSGYYHVFAHLPYTGSIATQVALGVVVNNASADATVLRSDNDGGYGTAAVSGVVYMDAGDYVRVSYYVQSGGPTVGSGTTGAAFFGIALLGA